MKNINSSDILRFCLGNRAEVMSQSMGVSNAKNIPTAIPEVAIISQQKSIASEFEQQVIEPVAVGSLPTFQPVAVESPKHQSIILQPPGGDIIHGQSLVLGQVRILLHK